MSQEKPNLLTIPSEIRLQILRYTLQEPERDHVLPNAFYVYWPRAFPEPDKYKPPFYGTAEMSKLFTICREIHDELETLLYTQFVFIFAHFLSLASARDFINPLSTRKKGLLREIMVPINLNLGFWKTEDDPAKINADQVRRKGEAFEYMRATLPGLRRVHIYPIFIGGSLDGSMPKGRLDEFADLIMDLVSIFTPNSEVVLFNTDRQQCRVDIMKVCNERLLELTRNRNGF